MTTTTYHRMFNLYEVHKGVPVWVGQTSLADDIMKFAGKTVADGVKKKIEAAKRK